MIGYEFFFNLNIPKFTNFIYKMAAVTKDQRQQLIILMKDGKEEYVLNQNFPYEIFIAAGFCPIFFTTTKQSAANLNIKILSNYFYTLLLFRASLKDVYFPVDLSIFNNKKDFLYSLSSYLNFTNINLWGSIHDSSLHSISRLYSGFSWVEREHREFLGLPFIGLKDSRRLLTDYTDSGADTTKLYKTLSYDLLTQNLYF